MTEVDKRLEGPPFRARRDGAVFDRPDGMELRLPVRIQATRFDDTEEVVDAVDLLGAEERIALNVEEEVAR